MIQPIRLESIHNNMQEPSYLSHKPPATQFWSKPTASKQTQSQLHFQQ
jgi:hypothetical protein